MSDAIERLIDRAIAVVRGYAAEEPEETGPRTRPPTPLAEGVPTLAPGVFRPATPQLAARYAHLGRWERATHGHWLGPLDMAALWEGPLGDRLLEGVRRSRIGAEQGWPDDAAALFRPGRLSLFAGDDDGYERIYLVWFESSDEPEVWSYDANGESRHRDLRAYLQAYLDGDLSAAFRPWRLEAEGLNETTVDAPVWNEAARTFGATIRLLGQAHPLTLVDFGRDGAAPAGWSAERIARWLGPNLGKARRYAARRLTGLKNEAWRDDDEAATTEDEFVARLELDGLIASSDGSAELYFRDGGLFDGHAVRVDLDASFGFERAGIVG